jgi:hypothetical protein
VVIKLLYGNLFRHAFVFAAIDIQEKQVSIVFCCQAAATKKSSQKEAKVFF